MSAPSRRHFLKTASATLATGGLTALHSAKAAGAEKSKHPNLIIVFPDQMRGQALGFLNEDPVITPHLDRFAQDSLVLKQAVANYPVCSPFRAMLMTGQYSHANKVTANCRSGREKYGVELQQSTTCWSDVLKSHNYSLGYIGKWHLDLPRQPHIKANGDWNEWCPPDRRHGFDFWYAYGTYNAHMRPMYWNTTARRNGYHFIKQWSPEHEADVAIDYINNKGGSVRNPDQPFALVVSMNPPHSPYTQYPKKYLSAYADKSTEQLLVRPNVSPDSKLAKKSIRDYFANITGVDEQFGRIIQALDQAGLKEDTIVLFTSDHGNCLGTHNQASKNNPYEEALRIPFILRWPGKIHARHDDLLISAPDIYPTLLELMGFKTSLPPSVQGTSHANLMLTGEGPRPSSQLYLKIPHDNPAYGTRGVRTHELKLVISATPNKALQTTLYNLKTDPYELSDIAAESPDIVTNLIHSELVPWLEKTNDPWRKNLPA